jgi:hypothetical protein
MRTVLRVHKRTRIKDMLVKLQCLSVEQRTAQKVLCFLKDVINNKFNSSFKEFLNKNGSS